jgi:UDP-N-acetylmuramyl pentapeptide phosphotransferase/UDP-N-acetylglucosamine-1-phosphate transferase
MGDVGSAFLGYTFAVIPLMLGADSRFQVRGFAPFIPGIILVWPFVFDSAFTLLRRLRFGENVFKAHRSHLYQRLVILGYAHRTVSLLYVGLAIIGVILALAAIKLRNVSVVAPVILSILSFTLWGLVIWSEQRAGVLRADLNPHSGQS